MRFRLLCAAALAAAATGALAGPVDAYRTGAEFCPQDRPRTAPRISEAQAVERTRALLPKDFCGITLSPSAMMRPIKSVSGVIGLGAGVKHNAYRCDLCDMRETCRGRTRPKRSVQAVSFA